VAGKLKTKPGEVYISKPLIARGGIIKDKPIVVMAAPVFYEELIGLFFFPSS